MIAFKLAWREIKNNKSYWSFFTANLCIGLMGFTFIYLFRSNITETLSQRAKTILSSDIAISGRRVLEKDEAKAVKEYLSPYVIEQTSLRELYSMGKSAAGSDTKSRLIFIKSIKGKYPLIGNIALDNGESFTEEYIQLLQEKPFVVISPEVAHQLKVKIGDKLRLGDQAFTIKNLIKSDSTSSLRGVNLAPKVYIGDAFLDKTNLIKFGTLGWYSNYYTLTGDSDLKVIKEELYRLVTDPAIKVETPENSSEQVGRVVNYLSDYLGLIGIVALLISCVGGSYLFQSYVLDRLKQIGILKSLGVSKKQHMSAFLLIIISFGILATVLALTLSEILLPLALSQLEQWTNFAINVHINFEMVLIVLAIGVLVNVLICLPILERIFQVPTIFLLNNKMDTKVTKTDYLHYLPGLVFLWILSVWQANSFKVGTAFTAALFLIFFVILLLLPWCLKRISKVLMVKKLTWPFNLSIGFSTRLVMRNKMTTILTVLCMGIGISLLSLIGQLDKTLKQELIGDTSAKPSLFLFDIQQEQHSELVKLAKKYDFPLKKPSPMVRARLIKKNGEKIKRQTKVDGFATNEAERRRRFNNRGVNLSYGEKLNSAEKIVDGKEFSGSYSGEGIAEISLEKRYASRMEVEVGDTLTYDVLGIEIQGRIVNLRTVNWNSFVPNFFITFQPGVLEEAPKTYLTSVDTIDFEKQLEVQDIIVERFPNISIINVTEVIDKIMNLFSAMAFAIGIMSLCCICVGLFVLYSILQSQMFKKQKDFALQKIIGMSEKEIFLTLFWEYFQVVTIALILGSGIGIILAIFVSQLFLDGLFVLNQEFFVGFSLAMLIISSLLITISFKRHYKKSILNLLN